MMDQGRQVGKLAHQLFPGGVEVRAGDPEEAIRIDPRIGIETQRSVRYLKQHSSTVACSCASMSCNAAETANGVLIEVKSSASLKDEHLEDVAIQYRVVSRSGLDLASACLAHVNRNYVYTGGYIDVWRFFRIKNLTRRVERLLPKLTFQLRSELRVLAMPNPPEIPTGPHCTDPITCEFFDRCNSPLPKDHIGYLPRLNASAFEELEEMGVESISDIPDDFPLSERQRRACTAVQTGDPWFSAELGKELESLKYPLYFMDFESVNPAIPRFSGIRPFDQLPFQWSLHLQRRPEAETEHYEFLATDRSDPRREFISSLCVALGESGSIVVYAAFESQRLSELAAWLPEFADQIKTIHSRLWDLLPVVRNYVYHPAFAGSYSLKTVLPALVPEMSYDGMEVANGQDAGLAWESLVRGGLDQTERERLRKALLNYCGQDTLALVTLLRTLLHRAS